jgi:hypothetical protein
MTVTENSFEIRDESPKKGGDPFLRGPYGPYTAHDGFGRFRRRLALAL